MKYTGDMKSRTVKACVKEAVAALQEAEELLVKQLESKEPARVGMLISRWNSVRFVIRYLRVTLDV